MLNARRLNLILACLLAGAAPVLAQNPPTPTPGAITQIDLVIEPRLVRFTTGERFEWRVEIRDLQNQLIFDSGVVAASALEWPLVDAQGQPVGSGTYHYTVTMRSAAPDGTRIHRGQLAIERTSTLYQIAAAGDETTGGTALSIVNPTTTDVASGVGAAEVVDPGVSRLPTHLGRTSFAAPQPYISGTGTTFAMTRWLDGPNGVVGDTNVTELNGSVVVGNGTFRGNLHVFGGEGNDVFAGMGPNLVTGPAFNYGYAGGSFGRSAGFFNVRPDASATPPNPSLRFMTANVQRMIITNAGKVGIGTQAPNHQVRIAGGPLWTSNQWEGALELEPAAAIAWRPFGDAPSSGIGSDNAGLYVFHTQSEPGSTSNPADYHMFIKNDGKVGIGTLNPLAQLDVQTASIYAVRGFTTAGFGYGVRGEALSPGGIGVYGIGPASGYAGYLVGLLNVTGGCTGCSPPSDRNLKANFASVNQRAILDRLAALPVQTWNYMRDADTVRHIGVMAQDFHAAFGFGESDKTLNTVDAMGVTMASIQALYELMKEKDAQIERLARQLRDQQVALDQLRRTVKNSK